MGWSFGSRSKRALAGVHPDLYRVVAHALSQSPIDFVVTEGRRTKARQAELVKAGASQTMRSRHLTGHAVDLAPIVLGKVRWDWPLFETLNEVMMEAATEEAIPLEWGGNWLRFRDGPHWQLPWDSYPSP